MLKAGAALGEDAGREAFIIAVVAGAILADAASHERFAAMALEPLPGSTPDSFADYIKNEVDRWAEIVKNSGAQLE